MLSHETMTEALKGSLGLEPSPQSYFDEILICPAANGYIVRIHRPNYGSTQYVFTSCKEMWSWLSEHVADAPDEGVNL